MLRKIFGIFSRYLGEKARYLGKLTGISGKIFRQFYHFYVIFVARPTAHRAEKDIVRRMVIIVTRLG